MSKPRTAPSKAAETSSVELSSDGGLQEDYSSADHFADRLQKLRGAVLRAWQLDLDRQGKGRATYEDFARTCRALGIQGESGKIWSSFRPANRREGVRKPLEFAELCTYEAHNVQLFVEVLGHVVDYDLDKAWEKLDPKRKTVVSLEEFMERSSKVFEFHGNMKLLFQGLDSTGLGRLTRADFQVLASVSPELRRALARRASQKSTGVPELAHWIEKECGGVEKFLESFAEARVEVDQFADHIAGLGFSKRKRAREVALRLSKDCKVVTGTYIPLDSLSALLSGKPVLVKRQPWKPTEALQPGLLSPRAQGPEWQDGVQDFSLYNSYKPPATRSYFSKPVRRTERRSRAGSPEAEHAQPQLQRDLAAEEDRGEAGGGGGERERLFCPPARSSGSPDHAEPHPWRGWRQSEAPLERSAGAGGGRSVVSLGAWRGANETQPLLEAGSSGRLLAGSWHHGQEVPVPANSRQLSGSLQGSSSLQTRLWQAVVTSPPTAAASIAGMQSREAASVSRVQQMSSLQPHSAVTVASPAGEAARQRPVLQSGELAIGSRDQKQTSSPQGSSSILQRTPPREPHSGVTVASPPTAAAGAGPVLQNGEARIGIRGQDQTSSPQGSSGSTQRLPPQEVEVAASGHPHPSNTQSSGSFQRKPPHEENLADQGDVDDMVEL